MSAFDPMRTLAECLLSTQKPTFSFTWVMKCNPQPTPGSSVVPHYYFHLECAGERIVDEEGSDLSDLRSVQAIAVRSAADLAAEDLKRGVDVVEQFIVRAGRSSRPRVRSGRGSSGTFRLGPLSTHSEHYEGEQQPSVPFALAS